MDWRNRKYYGVTFATDCQDLRMRNLRLIDGVKIRPYKHQIPKQKDEKRGRGWYCWMVSCPAEQAESVLYELRKAKRNDGICHFEEIKPNKRILPEQIIEQFIDKITDDNIDGIEDFLGHCITGDILECIDIHIRSILAHGLSDEEFEQFRKKYGIDFVY